MFFIELKTCSGRHEVVQKLVNSGVDINLKNSDGQTARDVANIIDGNTFQSINLWNVEINRNNIELISQDRQWILRFQVAATR